MHSLHWLPDGSSPRGRGTPPGRVSGHSGRRFIPARAGNARGRSGRGARTAVHLRAGGERGSPGLTSDGFSGSSPRGRGTRRRCGFARGERRFIPARAGNARTSRSGSPRPNGSSPRGRGTRAPRPPPQPRPRFIPARAGNAEKSAGYAAASAVHPRAGGERLEAAHEARYPIGSSPRGRGTRRSRDVRDGERRFIPARAGNARPAGPPDRPRPVHPRAGGERENGPENLVFRAGSSPRGRGTHRARAMGHVHLRFIPARAGNAARRTSAASGSPVHPRAGGERRPRARRWTATGGSSPRGRGTHPLHPARRRRLRFIPARAGNASSPPTAGRTRPVHPRAGGERTRGERARSTPSGSSPRGRGTPRVPRRLARG